MRLDFKGVFRYYPYKKADLSQAQKDFKDGIRETKKYLLYQNNKTEMKSGLRIFYDQGNIHPEVQDGFFEFLDRIIQPKGCLFAPLNLLPPRSFNINQFTNIYKEKYPNVNDQKLAEIKTHDHTLLLKTVIDFHNLKRIKDNYYSVPIVSRTIDDQDWRIAGHSNTGFHTFGVNSDAIVIDTENPSSRVLAGLCDGVSICPTSKEWIQLSRLNKNDKTTLHREIASNFAGRALARALTKTLANTSIQLLPANNVDLPKASEETLDYIPADIIDKELQKINDNLLDFLQLIQKYFLQQNKEKNIFTFLKGLKENSIAFRAINNRYPDFKKIIEADNALRKTIRDHFSYPDKLISLIVLSGLQKAYPIVKKLYNNEGINCSTTLVMAYDLGNDKIALISAGDSSIFAYDTKGTIISDSINSTDEDYLILNENGVLKPGLPFKGVKCKIIDKNKIGGIVLASDGVTGKDTTKVEDTFSRITKNGSHPQKMVQGAFLDEVNQGDDDRSIIVIEKKIPEEKTVDFTTHHQ